MTRDEILHAFATADHPPEDALRAGAKHARDIAPRIVELLRKAGEGVFLLPDQQNIVFFGLYALAAACETSAFLPLCAFLHRPENDLEPLLGDALTNGLTSLLTSLFDGDATALAKIIEDEDADGSVKWGVFNALAYLAFAGRVPRQDVVAVLRRFGEGEPVQNDSAWHGWRDAIQHLGVEELKARAIDTWIPDGTPTDREIDKQGWIDDFKPTPDVEQLNKPYIRPIDDPAAALSWIDPRRPSKRDPDDPAQDPLSDEELDWLAGLLQCSQAPTRSMSIEMLDGYFAALIAGPELVLPSRWMPRIWDSISDETITYDSHEQAELATKLLMRQWNTVAERLGGDYPHLTILDSYGTYRGVEWATGFSIGMSETPSAWHKIMRQPRGRDGVELILSLCAEEFDPDYNPATDALTEEERRKTVATIPIALEFIRKARMIRTPTRQARKTGRNDPCPCGSGRKFKLCCQGNEQEAANLQGDDFRPANVLKI